jgi:uncharacterized protein (TIGR02118 family)
MTGVKVVVIYPRPVDEAAFEAAYREEHIPMIEGKLKGITRFVASKVLESPQGKVAAYRLAELHFSSMDDLKNALQSEGAKELVEHATKLSTGGPPIILICQEESWVYW